MKHHPFALRVLSVTFAAAALAYASAASAQPGAIMSVPPPGTASQTQLPILKEVGLDQKLNAQVPLDLTFTDETGHEVTLGSLMGTRPVVLALVYYECPMLCTEVLNGLVASAETLSFDAGKQFDIIVVSFDPGETPSLAAQKKAQYVKRYGRPGAEAGMHFLTGRQQAIEALTNAVGFRY
jgi:protein SCO1/2